MTTTNGGQQAEAAAQGEAPQLNVVAQYIKDLSFENPNAPQSLQIQQQPQIGIQINVDAKPLSDTDIEVSLKLEGRAETGDQLLFGFELDFAGVFRIQGVPQESMQAVVLIECPRLLVPVRARDRRRDRAQWRLPAAPARPGGLRCALSPAHGADAAVRRTGGVRLSVEMKHESAAPTLPLSHLWERGSEFALRPCHIRRH